VLSKGVKYQHSNLPTTQTCASFGMQHSYMVYLRYSIGTAFREKTSLYPEGIPMGQSSLWSGWFFTSLVRPVFLVTVAISIPAV